MYHMSNIIVWDIETVPDLRGFSAANGHAGRSDDEVHEAASNSCHVTHRSKKQFWKV
jgi:hypothetical protein